MVSFRGEGELRVAEESIGVSEDRPHDARGVGADVHVQRDGFLERRDRASPDSGADRAQIHGGGPRDAGHGPRGLDPVAPEGRARRAAVAAERTELAGERESDGVADALNGSRSPANRGPQSSGLPGNGEPGANRRAERAGRGPETDEAGRIAGRRGALRGYDR